MEALFIIGLIIALIVWLARWTSAGPKNVPKQQYQRQRKIPPKFRPNTNFNRRKTPPELRRVHPNLAQPLVGKCHVIDGDTIVINRVHIRLFGIDAPELDHPFGNKAKWAMIHLCKGQTIRAVPSGAARIDAYERMVATCFLPDGRDLSEELVKQGLALDWPKYSDGVYRQYEPAGVRKKLWRANVRQGKKQA